MTTTFAQFRPTGFDLYKSTLFNRQDWLVAPVVETRDSKCLEQSNFAVVLDDLGGESDTVEVHFFFPTGTSWWVAIILVHPSLADHVEQWESALADYPVADDRHYRAGLVEEIKREWYWASTKQRIGYCIEAGISIFASRRNEIPLNIW